MKQAAWFVILVATFAAGALFTAAHDVDAPQDDAPSWRELAEKAQSQTDRAISTADTSYQTAKRALAGWEECERKRAAQPQDGVVPDVHDRVGDELTASITALVIGEDVL